MPDNIRPPPPHIIQYAARHLDDMTLPPEVRSCLGWLLDMADHIPGPPPPGAHVVYNRLAGPDPYRGTILEGVNSTVDRVLGQYSPSSPLADYLRRSGV